MKKPRRVPIAGTVQPRLEGVEPVGRPPAHVAIEVAICVRCDPAGDGRAVAARALERGQRLSDAEIERAFGADPADLERVVAFVEEHGAEVVESDARKRTVTARGTPAQWNEAFGIELALFPVDGGESLGYRGPIQVPEDLDGVISYVLGLCRLPVVRPPFHEMSRANR